MRLYFLFFTLLFNSYSHCKTIIFIDNSVSNDTYIASNKERQISIAFKMGLEQLRKNCDVKNLQIIGKEPLSIFTQSKEVKSIKDEKIIFGLIHSSEALLAAEAFKDSEVLALSSGAATDALSRKNSNFFSLANPISGISKHVGQYIKLKNIKQPIAIIPGNSSYSIELSKSLKLSLEKLGIDMQIELIDTNMNHQDFISKKLSLKKFDFIYVPGFLQQTLPIFESVSKTGFKGIVYGSANLARSKTDLQLFTSNLNLKNLNIRFPATWMSGETVNSKVMEKKFKDTSNEEIMGTAIYTYDAVLVSGSYLCQATAPLNQLGFIDFINKHVLTGKLGTIRKYHGFENGHLISKITTVKFNGVSQKMESE